MGHAPYAHRFAIALMCGALVLAGCGSPQEEAAGAVVRGAAARAMVVAGEAAVVSAGEGLSLELPANAAPAGAEIVLQPVSGAAPHAFGGLETLASYDVAVGEQRAFDAPLTLRFGYDPGALADDVDPADQLVVAYLDEDSGRWVESDVQVDTAAQQVVVTTDHLTLWSLFGLSDDTVRSSHPNFDIYFRQSLNAPALSEYRSGDAIFDFAVLVRSALVTAREGYAGTAGSGLKVPEKSKVYIDDWGADKTAEWGWFSKNIEIPVTYSTLEELQHDAAHELFHAVQNEYVTVATMMANRWWMEATADYGAAALGTGHGLSSTLPLAFITQALNSDEGMHMYQAAHFIRYLVDERGVDFIPLFAATMSSSDGVLQAINAHLNTRGDSLAEAYADFAFEFAFGTAVRREAVKTDLATDLASYAEEYTDPSTQVTGIVNVQGPYAASLVAYRVETGSDGPFGVGLSAVEPTSGVAVRYVIGGPAGAGDIVSKGLLAAGVTTTVEVEDGQTIYFLVTNAADSGGYVTVVIGEPQGGETTFETSRTAPMYNDDYTAEIALSLESTHPFRVVSEQTMYGGEYYALVLQLLRPVDEQHPATFNATAEVSGLAFADPDSCVDCTLRLREHYWYAPGLVPGSEAIVTTTGTDGPSTRLTYEVVFEYANKEGDVYQAGGAVLFDVRIEH